MVERAGNEPNLRKTSNLGVLWPELEGTVSAETAKRIGIKVPKHLQGKRIRILARPNDR